MHAYQVIGKRKQVAEDYISIVQVINDLYALNYTILCIQISVSLQFSGFRELTIQKLQTDFQ